MKTDKSTILIIDDDAEIRYSLDRVLSPDGHHIITADSGEHGVEVAEKENPQLIFLDNRMEGMSGIETLQHLRTAAPTSLVILMTAYGTTQTAIQAMKHGAFDYVLKPFDLIRNSRFPRRNLPNFLVGKTFAQGKCPADFFIILKPFDGTF